MNDFFQSGARPPLRERVAEHQFGERPPADFALFVKNGVLKSLAKLALDVNSPQDGVARIIAIYNGNTAMRRHPGRYAAFSGTNSPNQSDHRNDFAASHGLTARYGTAA
jgi:hypothetical protein